MATAQKPRMLGQRSMLTLMRLLADRGLSPEAVEAGLDYVEDIGARTVREAYELALSRVIYSDAELAQGLRFSCDDPPAAIRSVI